MRTFRREIFQAGCTRARSRLHPSALTGDHGVTIVELLVALLLAMILSTGLFYMMSGHTRTYRQQITSLRIQEDLWGAMEFLQRHVRQAGFGLGNCPGGRIMEWNGTAGTDPALTTTEAVWLAPIRVYNGCNLLNDAASPPCPLSDHNAPDSFTVLSGSPNASTIATRIVQPSPTWDTKILVDSPGSFGNASRLVLWQPGSTKPCTLFKTTGNPLLDSGTVYSLPHAPSGAYDPITAMNPPLTTRIFPAGGYDQGTLVFNITAARPRHFAVDIDPLNPQKVPRLVTWSTNAAVPSSSLSDLEVISDGIEDLQISFACDDDSPPSGTFEEGSNDGASGAPGARADDEWAYNSAHDADGDGNGLPDPMSCAQGIAVVRITLIARSPSEDDVAQIAKRPAAEDRQAATTPDAYGRRQLTVIVHPRNIGP